MPINVLRESEGVADAYASWNGDHSVTGMPATIARLV